MRNHNDNNHQDNNNNNNQNNNNNNNNNEDTTGIISLEGESCTTANNDLDHPHPGQERDSLRGAERDRDAPGPLAASQAGAEGGEGVASSGGNASSTGNRNEDAAGPPAVVDTTHAPIAAMHVYPAGAIPAPPLLTPTGAPPMMMMMNSSGYPEYHYPMPMPIQSPHHHPLSHLPPPFPSMPVHHHHPSPHHHNTNAASTMQYYEARMRDHAAAYASAAAGAAWAAAQMAAAAADFVAGNGPPPLHLYAATAAAAAATAATPMSLASPTSNAAMGPGAAAPAAWGEVAPLPPPPPSMMYGPFSPPAHSWGGDMMMMSTSPYPSPHPQAPFFFPPTPHAHMAPPPYIPPPPHPFSTTASSLCSSSMPPAADPQYDRRDARDHDDDDEDEDDEAKEYDHDNADRDYPRDEGDDEINQSNNHVTYQSATNKRYPEEEDVDPHRRKRRQHLPQRGGGGGRRSPYHHYGEDDIPRMIASNPPTSAPPPPPAVPQRSKVRRRLRSDGDNSSSTSSSSWHHWGPSAAPPSSSQPQQRSSAYPQFYGNNNSNHLRRRSAQPYHQYQSHNHHPARKKKARSDESLLGKTAVAALYEWCSRRNRMPSFEVTLVPPAVPAAAGSSSSTMSLAGASTSDQNSTSNGYGYFECVVSLASDVAPAASHLTQPPPPHDDATSGGEGATTPCPRQQVVGRGRGRNKNAARQDAARKALQTLCPAAVFDASSGFVVQLRYPHQTATSSASLPAAPDCAERSNATDFVATTTTAVTPMVITSPPPLLPLMERQQRQQKNDLEELAPNLAKQLAIGECQTPAQEQDRTALTESDAWKTAAEDESRLSDLLFTTIQIDPRIKEPVPTFTYEMAPVIVHSSKRKTSEERGRFTCTAQLELHTPVTASLPSKQRNTTNHNKAETNTDKDPNDPDKSQDQLVDSSQPPPRQYLQAQGVGASKREARHLACARLLALLFPTCQTAAEVKAAAEAARAQYKGRKRNHWAVATDPPLPGAVQSTLSRLAMQQSADSTATMTPETGHHLVKKERQIDKDEPKGGDGDDEDDDDNDRKPPAQTTPSDSDGSSRTTNVTTARLLLSSRQRQMDVAMERALQQLNEEEGRDPLDDPENDVGRTMLRRAEPDDMLALEKLFANSSLNSSKNSWSWNERRVSAQNRPNKWGQESGVAGGTSNNDHASGRHDDYGINNNDVVDAANVHVKNLLAQWRSPYYMVLLLCRAIAAYEDPPLGCAVLATGFSWTHGRLLRPVRLATESILPQERFLECLQDFARCMNYAWVVHNNNINTVDTLSNSLLASNNEYGKHLMRLTLTDTRAIVQSYLTKCEESSPATAVLLLDEANASLTSGSAQPPLQSVQEEETEGSEEASSSSSVSTLEKRVAMKKRQSKPSKRSRFQ